VYNIKAAVSRLPAGPETDRMEVTDIESGHFVFPPLPGEPIRRDSLYKALEGAGYEMTDAWLAVTGRLASDLRLEALESGQPFVLTDGAEWERLREATAAGDTVSVHGAWTPGAEADTVRVLRWVQGTEVPEGEGKP
jgi:hypothetical protein